MKNEGMTELQREALEHLEKARHRGEDRTAAADQQRDGLSDVSAGWIGH